MEKHNASKKLWRLSAMGFTFISMVISGGILGWVIHWLINVLFIDFSMQSRVFVVIGAICGIIVGMTEFFRNAFKALKDQL